MSKVDEIRRQREEAARAREAGAKKPKPSLDDLAKAIEQTAAEATAKRDARNAKRAARKAARSKGGR